MDTKYGTCGIFRFFSKDTVQGRKLYSCIHTYIYYYRNDNNKSRGSLRVSPFTKGVRGAGGVSIVSGSSPAPCQLDTIRTTYYQIGPPLIHIVLLVFLTPLSMTAEDKEETCRGHGEISKAVSHIHKSERGETQKNQQFTGDPLVERSSLLVLHACPLHVYIFPLSLSLSSSFFLSLFSSTLFLSLSLCWVIMWNQCQKTSTLTVFPLVLSLSSLSTF